MKISNGVMLNAYPDSIGKDLSDMVGLLSRPEFDKAFSLFYILPTFFNSDLDRGFSIIDYNINEELVSKDDLQSLNALGIQLKFDIVLNHLSVGSPQFQDLLQNGDDSEYKDFFIDWNEFWKGHGEIDETGIVIPKKEYLDKLFMRKSGLPILEVPFPDGSTRPYWNTFYQKVTTKPISILGQMDVNGRSSLVWKFYEEVLEKVKSNGGKILRLDAFAYLHKEVGKSNFFNKPGTWEYLSQINEIAQKNELLLLPEIHSEYGSHLHDEVANEGYFIYDFFLPGLVIHTLEKNTNTALLKWAKEVVEKQYKTVNMLGCHDGIPVLDLKGKEVSGSYNEGLLSDHEIDDLINTILNRGGKVKNLYGADGKKISYYQINATYFSALGESEKKLLLARAIQLFMPGIPQIWYLDLFAGTNDYEAVERAGEGGHKEINRTNLSIEYVQNKLNDPIVLKQLEMVKVRNQSDAFNGKVEFNKCADNQIDITWSNGNTFANLEANLTSFEYKIEYNSRDQISTITSES